MRPSKLTVTRLAVRRRDEVVSILSGAAAFSLTMAISTSVLQSRLLHVSTGTPAPIPSSLGLLTVAIASVGACAASVESWCWLRYDAGASRNSCRMRRRDRVGKCSIGHLLRVSAVGLLAFRALGGRFWSIAPSSYTHLGSYARCSLPATEAYATQAQRLAIDDIGRRFGCHTCGTKFPTKFHADHMPPISVARQLNRRWFRRFFGFKVRHRFFPQCISCSNRQGALLSSALKRLGGREKHRLATVGGGLAAYDHGLQPRLHHLTGAVISTITVVGTAPSDVSRRNEERFLQIQLLLLQALVEFRTKLGSMRTSLMQSRRRGETEGKR